MLPCAGQVGKLEIHEFDPVVFDHFGDVGWCFLVRHGWWLKR
jgi:hypothetical protein